MKEYKDSIGFLIVTILVIALGIICSICEVKASDKLWNNGYCPKCGCAWHYQDMYHTRNGANTYIYVDKENHTIEVHKNYGLGVDK